MSDLVGNTEDRFSQNEAHMVKNYPVIIDVETKQSMHNVASLKYLSILVYSRVWHLDIMSRSKKVDAIISSMK